MSSDDQPWMTSELKQINRKKCREFSKHRRSDKWFELNKLFKSKCEKAKSDYYKNIVSDLKSSNPRQWYLKLKRMSSYDQHKMEEHNVAEIEGLSNKVHAEFIANYFSKISNEYDPLKTGDINFPIFDKKDIPQVKPFQVYEYLKAIKVNKAAVKGDIPPKIIKEFAAELAAPLCNIINSMIKNGEYPNIWKVEAITPAPKVFPPPKVSNLRKISGTLQFSKIAEKIVSKFVIQDMMPTREKSQYGNEKGLSLQHYLIKMLHKILSSLDRNSRGDTCAVVISMFDWKLVGLR